MGTEPESGIEALRWSLRLLGGFDLKILPGVESINSLGKRERVLLAFLALSPNGRASRRRLATLLWGDTTDEAATDNLRVCIFNLRKALGEAGHRAIASEGQDLVLDPAAFDVDALTFRRLAAGPGRAELERAAQLYCGEFLDGVDLSNDEYESWRRQEAGRFRDRIVDVLARLMAILADSREVEPLIETGTRLLQLDPLHEGAVRHLMRAYSESGRRGTAAQLYRTFADTLKRELNAQPEPQTQVLLAEISQGAAPPPASPVATPPAAQTFYSAPIPSPQPQQTFSAPPTFASATPPRRSHLLRGIGAAGLAAAALMLFLAYQRATVPEVASGATGPISIAVLPFVNLSGDKGQEFFSDGMTEEITSALAKVPGLRVVARTSAYQFKGENLNVEDIAKQLQVNHLVEGSVRRNGDQLRVTAQLIDATGSTEWSESYNRQLTGIFEIQEDIGIAIAGALRMPLGLRPGKQLISNRAIDPDSYQQFLRGKAALLKAQAAFAEQLALLEPVVAKNPNYAPAWAAVSQAYNFAAAYTRNGSPEESTAYQTKMIAAARRAVELDPDLVEAQVQYTLTISGPRRLALIEDALTHALDLDPNNPVALERYSNLLMALGRLKEAIALKQRSHDLDPFIPVRNNNFAEALWLDGQTDAAIALLKDSVGRVGRPGIGAEQDLARIYVSMARYDDAVATIAPILKSERPQRIKDQISEAIRLLRSAPAKSTEPGTLPPQSGYNFIYLYLGAPERALEPYAKGGGGFPGLAELWHPDYAPVRKLASFKKLMRDEGLVAYWRERGWPKFCHPVGDDDFACN